MAGPITGDPQGAKDFEQALSEAMKNVETPQGRAEKTAEKLLRRAADIRSTADQTKKQENEIVARVLEEVAAALTA